MARTSWSTWTRFEEPEETPLFGMHRGAVFSAERRIRWLLTRRLNLPWARGHRPRRLAFLMANSSDAGHEHDDPTLLQCIAIATRLGCDEFSVVNTEPLVASQPDQLEQLLDSLDRATHRAITRRNIDFIHQAMQAADIRIAAWGRLPSPSAIATAIVAVGAHQLHHLGTNSDGSPRHPMARGRNRISKTQMPVPWPATDASAYLADQLARTQRRPTRPIAS